MASKLMVIKQTRPSLDVEFYITTIENKAAIREVPLAIVSGERNMDGGLDKLRTLFFANAQSYTDWQASELIQSTIVAREAYNTANGIVTEINTVDMPDYNPI